MGGAGGAGCGLDGLCQEIACDMRERHIYSQVFMLVRRFVWQSGTRSCGGLFWERGAL